MGESRALYQASGLSLSVDLNAKSGQLSLQRGGLNINASVKCVTAGWLDPAVVTAPTFAVNFSSAALPPSIIFSRATTGTFEDSSGMLRTSAANQPRFEYDLNGQIKGLLLERDATNLFRFSEQLQNPVYMTSEAVIIADQTVAPDGSNTADLLRETSGNVSPYVAQAGTGNQGASNTCSAFIKPNGRTTTIVKINGSSPVDFCETHADLATNTYSPNQLGVATNCQAFMEPLASGWFRVAVSGVVTPGGGDGPLVCAVFPSNQPLSSPVLVPYTGDGTGGIFVWGLQLEVGPIPTSYIATTNTTATRDADSAVVSTAGWFNATTGSIWAAADKYFANPIGFPSSEKLFSLVATNGDEASVYYEGAAALFGARIQSASAGTSQWSSTANAGAKNDHRFVLGYGGSASSLMVDGIQADAPTGADLSINANSLHLGGSGAGSWNGHLKAITFWPKRLPADVSIGLSK